MADNLTPEAVEKLALAIASNRKLRDVFIDKMGLSRAIGGPGQRRRDKKKNKRQTTEQAQKISALYGDSTHPDGFEPTPPEDVVQAIENLSEVDGDILYELWLDKWDAGQLGGSFLDKSREDLEMEVQDQEALVEAL